jgi:hypothetical protein
LVRETEVLGKNIPQCRFVHHKTHMLLIREPGRRGGKPATNCLSYDSLLDMRENRYMGHVASRIGEIRNAYNIFVEKPEETI